jgi:hypothetical protein
MPLRTGQIDPLRSLPINLERAENPVKLPLAERDRGADTGPWRSTKLATRDSPPIDSRSLRCYPRALLICCAHLHISVP